MGRDLEVENERLRDALRAITEVDRYGLPGVIATHTLRETTPDPERGLDPYTARVQRELRERS